MPARRLSREEHRGLIIRIETPGGQLEEIALPPNIDKIQRQTLAERKRHLLREAEDGTPAPSSEDIRNRILFEQTRPRPRSDDSSRPGRRGLGRPAESEGGSGFSAWTVDERVRHYCPFPHRTRPPERFSLSTAHSKRTRPTFKRCFPLQATLPPTQPRVTLPIPWDEDEHGVVLTGPFPSKDWRPTTRSYECHPWSLARYRLLPVALTTRGTGLHPLQKRPILRRSVRSNGKMTLEGMTSAEQSPAPSTTWNRSRLRHRHTVWRTKPLGSQSYRAHGHRSSPERELRYFSLGLSRAPTSWLRADTDPHAGYPCGRGGLLESEGSMHGTRLPRKKEGVPFDHSQTRTSLLNAKIKITKNKITPEGVCDPVLELVTSILCPSVVLMTLCLHLTSRPVQNTAAASCNLAVNDNEIRVMSMCCYPQCSLGPDTPERNSSCPVYCCPKCEFIPKAPEVNHPCLVGLLIVWTCTAPFSEAAPEAAPSSVELTSASPFPVSSRPSAVLGTIRDVFLRRVDPPRTTDVERKIPARRANQLCARVEERGPCKKARPILDDSVAGRCLLDKVRSVLYNTVDGEDPRQDKKVKPIMYSRTEGSGPH